MGELQDTSSRPSPAMVLGSLTSAGITAMADGVRQAERQRIRSEVLRWYDRHGPGSLTLAQLLAIIEERLKELEDT